MFANGFMEGPPDNSVTHNALITVSRPNTSIPQQQVTSSVVNAWTEMPVAFQAPAGTLTDVELNIAGSGSERYSLWVDRIAATETTYVREQPPNYSNGNQLYQAARRFLVECHAGVSTYDSRFVGLARLDSAQWPDDELVIGGYVRLTHPDTGAAVLLRVLELRPNYLVEANTEVTLSSSPFSLTSRIE